MKNRLLELLKIFFGWPISLIALFFIIRLIAVQSQNILSNLTHIHPFLLFCGFSCFVLYFLIRTYLWKKILEQKGYTIPIKDVSFLWASSELRRFIPGNIWAFLTRTVLFSGKKIDKKTIAFALIKEAQFVCLGSALMSVFSFSFVFSTLLAKFIHTNVLLSFSYLFLAFTCLFTLYENTLKNLSLLTISVCAFFFFSLGMYFTISSVVILSPYYFLTFISFFALSYLVGYVSLIAPMGLGVREAIITFGLTRFIPITLSGFAAIFARIILIFSELLFYALVACWFYAKSNSIESAERFLKKYVYEVLLGLCVTTYSIYFSVTSLLRYDNFYTGRFDLGNMDQVVWNTFRGRIFQLTDPNGTEIISRLAFHADFFLVLLAPLYRIWADPRTLLLVQTVVVASGAIFVFLIAQKILQQKMLALTFAGMYLLNPSVQYANLFDFHAVTLATTFLFATFYFLSEKKYFWFIFFAVLAGTTKENVWIIISFFGLYLVYTKEKGKQIKTLIIVLGLLLSTFSVALFYFLVWYAIPHARGAEHFALSYYSDFGATPTNILKNILLTPQKTLYTLIHTGSPTYIFQLFFPLGFLSLLSPFYLLFALPDFFINLLSNNTQLRQIYYHYTALLTPFIFISAIYGAKKVKIFFPRIAAFLPFFLVTTTIISVYLFGPLPGAKTPNAAMFTSPQQDSAFIDRYLSKIKKRYSVAATNNLGSHLSRRQRIYTIPLGIEKADIVVFLLNDPFAQPSLSAQKKMVEDLKKNKNYILLMEKGDFVAFQKK